MTKIESAKGWVFVWTRSLNKPGIGFVIGESFAYTAREAREYMVKLWDEKAVDPRTTWKRIYRQGGRVMRTEVKV